MEFRQISSSTKRLIRLQMYSTPPTEELSLQEVEELAVERLKVLKCVESVGHDLKKGSKEYREKLTAELEKCGAPRLGRPMTLPSTSKKCASDDIRLDIISHFILLVAYCRSEDLRRWFLQNEIDLFLYRFNIENLASSDTISTFLKMNNIQFSSVDISEIKRLSQKLEWGTASVLSGDTVFYKVHFTEVLDLVKKRKVFLERGFAFVPEADLISLVAARFRGYLSKSLSLMSKSLPQIEEDSRVLPMLSALSKRYLGENYSGTHMANVDAVTAVQIDELSRISFPPCMQQIHQTLRRDSHLRHFGRIQYQLFLKGIGLPMDESLKFFQQGFRAKTDSDKFDKQYAYNIRYNYGKEGKRVNYTPFSCVKIITNNAPGPGDCHGCPFRHNDPEILSQRLKSMKFTSGEVEEMVRLSKEMHFQLACGSYFKSIHKSVSNGSNVDVAINHPNQYYALSRALLSGQKIGGGVLGSSVSQSDSGAKVVIVKGSSNSQTKKEGEWWENDMDVDLSQVDIP